MNTTLVIMAAGMGSRFSKTELKQLTGVGPNNEIIMDYSIYDAIQAGFNKVVFIIRKELEAAFEKTIASRIRNVIQVEYVYQELDKLPEDYHPIEGRLKPLGTGHAILCCKGVVNEPFVIINADDYYGKEAFQIMHDDLVSNLDENAYCMAGFILKNTLSKNGSVSRGICEVVNGQLKDVVENKNIEEKENGIISIDEKGMIHSLQEDIYVSMNMWGVKPSFFTALESEFQVFLDHMKDPMKDEYLLPEVINHGIHEGKWNVTVLETKDRWFGVTYEAEKQMVKENFKQLVKQHIYPSPLF